MSCPSVRVNPQTGNLSQCHPYLSQLKRGDRATPPVPLVMTICGTLKVVLIAEAPLALGALALTEADR
jgi:hypothetical protein